jgi:hypothetical protein
MIRKILIFPLRVLRFFLLMFGIVYFIIMGLLDYIIQNKGSPNPIKYSRNGKVVDLDDFRADQTRGE